MHYLLLLPLVWALAQAQENCGHVQTCRLENPSNYPWNAAIDCRNKRICQEDNACQGGLECKDGGCVSYSVWDAFDT
ncbi:unnamed protein product [Cercospora beticola]|nr:unnamed protein product [Cercospora beticola]